MQEQPKPQPAPAKPVVQQPRRFGPQGPGIVFDSDMGRNIDAALALAALYSLGAKGHVIAVGVSTSSLEAAEYCDAVARFYAGDPALRNTGNTPVLSVGLPEDGAKLDRAAMLTAPLALKKEDGSPAFRSGLRDVRDTADVRVLFRNALMGQRDREGIVILAGPATNLMRTLALNGGKETIAAKVGLLVVGAGAYPEGSADPRIRADAASARQLFAKWPSPIVAVGSEIGAAMPYPGHSIETDFTWAPQHPIVEAYRAFQGMPYDAPAPALAAVLYAANQKESYFQLSEPGTIEVLDDGRTRFTRSENGRHRYLMADPAQKERVQKAYAELVSSKPAPPRRFQFQ